MIFFYRLIINFIIILSPAIILIRLLKKKEHPKRYKEKFCFFSKKRVRGNLIWFHGSSVGEILSVIPLIEKLEKNSNINQILVTSSTLSSSLIFNKYKFKKTIHQFFPIDSKKFCEKFLNYWRPSITIFIDSEIWPNMFIEIKKKSIPLLLLNARITKKSFKNWSKLKKFSKYIFEKIDIAYPQNFETLNYLKKMKIANIKIIGNLKFTENSQDKIDSLSKKFIQTIKERKVWCASSTHADEELLCAKVHINLKRKYKNLLTVIIPRHTHRLDEIKEKIENLGLKIISRSSDKKIFKDTDIYLVDTYGETQKFYKISNPVFLGGSMSNPDIKKGGQNPIEPARIGSSILHGPNISNFTEVYTLFQKNKISYKAKNLTELTQLTNKLVKNSKNSKKKYLRIKKLGNTILNQATLEINKILKDEIKKA